MHRVFDQASSERGRHYFCFHVTFFFIFPPKLYFLLLFQLPDLKKNPQNKFSILTSKTPQQPELA